MADQYVAVSTMTALTPTAAIILGIGSAGAARRLNLNELGISFNGTSSTATPLTVSLVRSSGSPANPGSNGLTQAATPLDPSAPASSFTAYAPLATALWTGGTTPTAGVILRSWLVPPTSGIVIQFPLGQEPDGPATTGSGLSISVAAPATAGAIAYLVWSE